jgi:iron complex transport system ATP-binding protein
MTPLRVENLNFSYGKNEVIRNLSFSIESGAVTTILGPNGSGKTTLLKLLLGLFLPQNGNIYLYDRPLSDYELKERALKLAYVPQKHIPAFSFSVIDIVAMGRHPHGSIFSRTGTQDLAAAQASLERLKIQPLADRPYTEISGGEQQLVLIARALTQQTEILIMDEPVSGLDYGNQILLLQQLQSLAREGITCITTSHFPEHALWIAEHAIFLKNGSLLAAGKAREIINSENLKSLYDADIKVIETQNSQGKIKTCVPDFCNL